MSAGARFACLCQLILVCGCAGTQTSFVYCDLAYPIYLADTDLLSIETGRQILAHNETWQAICREQG